MNLKAISLALGVTLIDPITVTINELAEHYDAIEKTVFNPDFVIRAWGNWLKFILAGGYLIKQSISDPTT